MDCKKVVLRSFRPDEHGLKVSTKAKLRRVFINKGTKGCKYYSLKNNNLMQIIGITKNHCSLDIIFKYYRLKKQKIKSSFVGGA